MVIKNNKHHEHYNRPENITLNDYRAELENYLRLDLGMQGASNYMNSIKDSQLNSGINEIFKCSNELANDYYVMNTSDEAQGFLYCCISEKFIDLIQKDPTHKSAIEHIDVGTSVRGYIKRTNEKIIQMEKKVKCKVSLLGIKMIGLIPEDRFGYPESLPYTPRFELILKERKIKSLSLFYQATSFINPNTTVIMDKDLADNLKSF